MAAPHHSAEFVMIGPNNRMRSLRDPCPMRTCLLAQNFRQAIAITGCINFVGVAPTLNFTFITSRASPGSTKSPLMFTGLGRVWGEMYSWLLAGLRRSPHTWNAWARSLAFLSSRLTPLSFYQITPSSIKETQQAAAPGTPPCPEHSASPSPPLDTPIPSSLA